MDLEQGYGFRELKGMFARRLPAIAWLTGGSLLVSIFVASVLSNQYESAATLLVEPQTVSEDLIDSGIEEQDLNARLHLIQMQIMSRGGLSQVIDDLGLYPELSSQMTREELIDRMRENISVEPVLPELETEAKAQAGVRSTDVFINTFRIAFRHPNAETAAAVANRLASDFIDEHIKERVQISGDTSEFIRAELAELSGRIRKVEKSIAEVKAQNAGRLPEDLVANQRLHERAIDARRDAQRQLAIAESDEAFYRQQAVTGASTEIYAYRNSLTPARRLEALQADLDNYTSRGFTEKHPDVIATKEQIAAIEKTMEDSVQEGENLSIAQQNARAEQQRAALRAAAARAEVKRLTRQIQEVEERLEQTPKVAEQLAALEREHEHLFGSYQEYSTKLQEAEVAASMERRQKGEQFRVLEAAYPSTTPVSPNRPLIVALGLILGLALGGGVALVQEAADSSYHEPRKLQEELRIPVLAAIPTVALAADLAQERRRRWRHAIAAAVVTAGVLVASLVGNWWVNGLPGPIAEHLSGGTAQTAQVAGGGR